MKRAWCLGARFLSPHWAEHHCTGPRPRQILEGFWRPSWRRARAGHPRGGEAKVRPKWDLSVRQSRALSCWCVYASGRTCLCVHVCRPGHTCLCMYMLVCIRTPMNVWSLHMSRAAVLHNPRDFHLHYSLSEWLCTVQQQGTAGHSDYNAHVHMHARLWVRLYVYTSVYVYVCLGV